MEEKRAIVVDDFEQRLMLKGLMEFRNNLIENDKPIEDVNTLINKTINAQRAMKKWCKDER